MKKCMEPLKGAAMNHVYGLKIWELSSFDLSEILVSIYSRYRTLYDFEHVDQSVNFSTLL